MARGGLAFGDDGDCGGRWGCPDVKATLGLVGGVELSAYGSDVEGVGVIFGEVLSALQRCTVRGLMLDEGALWSARPFEKRNFPSSTLPA